MWLVNYVDSIKNVLWWFLSYLCYFFHWNHRKHSILVLIAYLWSIIYDIMILLVDTFVNLAQKW